MATLAQIEEQKTLGLDIGCYVCRQEKDYTSRPLTAKDLNPHCVGCKQLYCQRHQSDIDIYYCHICLS